MRRDSILIVVLESNKPHGFPLGTINGPPQVRRNNFLPGFKGVPPSHAFARVLFTKRGRYFDIWVQFGGRPTTARLVREANRVLATLRVTAS